MAATVMAVGRIHTGPDHTCTRITTDTGTLHHCTDPDHQTHTDPAPTAPAA